MKLHNSYKLPKYRRPMNSDILDDSVKRTPNIANLVKQENTSNTSGHNQVEGTVPARFSPTAIVTQMELLTDSMPELELIYENKDARQKSSTKNWAQEKPPTLTSMVEGVKSSGQKCADQSVVSQDGTLVTTNSLGDSFKSEPSQLIKPTSCLEELMKAFADNQELFNAKNRRDFVRKQVLGIWKPLPTKPVELRRCANTLAKELKNRSGHLDTTTSLLPPYQQLLILNALKKTQLAMPATKKNIKSKRLTKATKKNLAAASSVFSKTLLQHKVVKDVIDQLATLTLHSTTKSDALQNTSTFQPNNATNIKTPMTFPKSLTTTDTSNASPLLKNVIKNRKPRTMKKPFSLKNFEKTLELVASNSPSCEVSCKDLLIGCSPLNQMPKGNWVSDTCPKRNTTTGLRKRAGAKKSQKPKAPSKCWDSLKNLTKHEKILLQSLGITRFQPVVQFENDFEMLGNTSNQHTNWPERQAKQFKPDNLSFCTDVELDHTHQQFWLSPNSTKMNSKAPLSTVETNQNFSKNVPNQFLQLNLNSSMNSLTPSSFYFNLASQTNMATFNQSGCHYETPNCLTQFQMDQQLSLATFFQSQHYNDFINEFSKSGLNNSEYQRRQTNSHLSMPSGSNSLQMPSQDNRGDVSNTTNNNRTLDKGN